MNDDLQTHALLTRAVGQEPPFIADVASVISEATGLRQRRRVARGSALAVGTCAVLGAAFVIVPSLGSSPSGQPTTAVAPGAGGAATTASSASRPATDVSATTGVRTALTGVDATIAAAIRASSPSGWTLALPRADSEPGIDGTADDGAGKGRIAVWLSSGTQQVHPCTDSEFKAGVSCTERALPDGAVLSLRGLVVATNGVATYEVALTYPDGSGVTAEAGNFTIGPVPKVLTPQAKRNLVKTERPAPTYSLTQLEAVVLAVNAATH